MNNGSNLWVMVQILWVNVEKKGSISMSQCWKEGFNFYESCWKEGSILWVMLNRMKDSILWVMLNRRVQFFESFWKEGFNSVSQIKKMGSIQWVIFFTIRFNSWCHISKCTMLRVIVEKNFESHSRKSSILCVTFKEQYLWVLLKKGFNS